MPGMESSSESPAAAAGGADGASMPGMESSSESPAAAAGVADGASMPGIESSSESPPAAAGRASFASMPGMESSSDDRSPPPAPPPRRPPMRPAMAAEPFLISSSGWPGIFCWVPIAGVVLLRADYAGGAGGCGGVSARITHEVERRGA